MRQAYLPAKAQEILPIVQDYLIKIQIEKYVLDLGKHLESYRRYKCWLCDSKGGKNTCFEKEVCSHSWTQDRRVMTYLIRKFLVQMINFSTIWWRLFQFFVYA